MFSELVARNSRRSRRENGLFFTSLLISIVAFYIILSLSHQDVMVFLQRMESSAVDRLLSLVPVLYGLTLFILFFLVYYANRFQLARRRHEFGVYLMLGMQRRKLFGMLLAEDLRSSLIALAIGLPAALLISEVISLVTARLVGLGIMGHRFTLSLSAAPCMGSGARMFCAVPLAVTVGSSSGCACPCSRMAVMAKLTSRMPATAPANRMTPPGPPLRRRPVL